MASEPDNSTSREPVKAAQIPPRVISIYQISGFVLPWNTAFKASRALNTSFALEPGATPLQTLWASARALSLGAYASRLQPMPPVPALQAKAEAV